MQTTPEIGQKTVLWISDTVSSGYGLVTKTLLPFLTPEYKVYVMSINHSFTSEEAIAEHKAFISDRLNIPSTQIIVKMYPPLSALPPRLGPTMVAGAGANQGDNLIDEFVSNLFMGVFHLHDVIDQCNPDIIVSINDKQVLTNHIKVIRRAITRKRPSFLAARVRTIGYMPIDCSNFPYNFFKELEGFDELWTMYENGKQEILKTGFSKPVYVLEHPISNAFTILPRREIEQYRKRLLAPSANLDSTIILNWNEESDRKRNDLTLDIFENLLEKTNQPFFLVMKGREGGKLQKRWEQLPFHVQKLIKIICHKLSLQELNLLYNAADVCINTASGEGWGLIPFEMLKLHKKCIVPDNTSYSEFFPSTYKVKTTYVPLKTGRHLEALPNVATINRVLLYAVPCPHSEEVSKNIEFKNDMNDWYNPNIKTFMVKTKYDLQAVFNQMPLLEDEMVPFQVLIEFVINKEKEQFKFMIDLYNKQMSCIDNPRWRKWNVVGLNTDCFTSYIIEVGIISVEHAVELAMLPKGGALHPPSGDEAQKLESLSEQNIGKKMLTLLN